VAVSQLPSRNILHGFRNMKYVIDQNQSDAGPNAPGGVGIARRADTDEVHRSRNCFHAAGKHTIGREPVTIRRRSIVGARIAVAVTAMLSVVTSQSVAGEREAASPAHAAEYLPSISDLMIATIQPRYERIWRGEQDENWDFAAYEVGNLRGAFSRLGNAHPIEHDISFPEIIASVTEKPFKELNSAIQSKDHTAFAKAYADLTDACNSCHQALNHGVVEIRVPTRTFAPDLGTHSKSRN
jgi:hypothetical protein